MNPSIVTVSRNDRMLDPIVNQMAALGVSWICSNLGKSAIAAIGRHTPDLVIVDSGTKSDAQVLADLHHIRCRYPAIPIFLIAQKSSETLAIGAIKAKVDGYYKAPFSVSTYRGNYPSVSSPLSHYIQKRYYPV